MRSLVLIEVSFFLSLPEGLRIEWVEPQGADLSVGVVSLLPSSCCPLCAQASSQVHSQYQRTLHDVPCGGRKVVLHLLSVSASAAILTARAKSLLRGSPPLFSRGRR